MNKGKAVGSIILLIIIIAIVAVVAMQYHPAPVAPKPTTGTLAFQLTDPPEVPNGTQSLIITYSSLSAHVVAGNGTTAWISAEGSGTINLLSIINISQIIGKATVPINSSIDMVKFNITSATITIDNTTYNVTVPSQQLIVHVSNSNKINGTATALIDITPVVATVYTQNSTLFIMVPSLRAIVVGSNSTSSTAGIGAKTSINAMERHELKISKPNITLSNITLSESSNITSFAVTVTNNGNSSINVKHILIFGNESVSIVASGMAVSVDNNKIYMHHDVNSNIDQEMPAGSYGIGAGSGASSSFGFGNSGMAANLSAVLGINASTANTIIGALNSTELGSISKGFANGSAIGISNIINRMHSINMSIDDYQHLIHAYTSNSTLTKILNVTDNEKDQIDVGISMVHFRVINFFISQNGTLVLPFITHNMMLPNAVNNTTSELENEAGYTIPAHSSKVFMFKGTIGFGNGSIGMAVIPGTNYNIIVIGEDGARSSANITAS